MQLLIFLSPEFKQLKLTFRVGRLMNTEQLGCLLCEHHPTPQLSFPSRENSKPKYSKSIVKQGGISVERRRNCLDFTATELVTGCVMMGLVSHWEP